MPVHENEIRHNLAGNLALLEPHLTLVQENYPLPNSVGTRGFIDILARDRHEVFVVIELKRSNSSAREALHEVMKYTELLRREQGLPAQDIRSILISTSWDELRVPFSHFARSWEFNISGLMLALDTDGVTPLGVEEIDLLAEAPERSITPIHSIFTGQSVRACWDNAQPILRSVGADDLVGVHLKHADRGELLYLALGRVVAEDPRTTLLDYLAEDVPEDTVEVPEEFFMEYRALCYLTDNLDSCSPSIAYPEKFGVLVDQMGWTMDSVMRTGIFERQRSLIDDEELARQLRGETEHSQIQFTGSSNPSNIAHWERFKNRVEHALFGNPSWTETMKCWLDEVSNQESVDVVLATYNPCDLVGAFIYGWPNQLEGYLPHLQAAVDHIPPVGRIVHGTLASTSTETLDFESIVRGKFNSATNWAMARNLGELWELDLELLHDLKLTYMAVEFSDLHPDGALLEVSGSGLHRRPPDSLVEGAPDWPGYFPLSSFFSTHAPSIEQTVLQLRSAMYPALTGEGPDQASYLFTDLPRPD